MPGNPQNPVPQDRSKAGQFKKGQSGNPGGRPKGLSSLIREETQDGLEYVEHMLKVARGLAIKRADGEYLNPTLDQMTDAWNTLADRGWGKAVQATEVTGADGEALSFTIIRKVAK